MNSALTGIRRWVVNYVSVDRYLPPRRAFGSASNTTTSYCLPLSFQHISSLSHFGALLTCSVAAVKSLTRRMIQGPPPSCIQPVLPQADNACDSQFTPQQFSAAARSAWSIYYGCNKCNIGFHIFLREHRAFTFLGSKCLPQNQDWSMQCPVPIRRFGQCKSFRWACPVLAPIVHSLQLSRMNADMDDGIALYTALNMLGYKSYHCAEIRLTAPGTYDLWNEALRAKYHGKGKRYGKAEFDKLLGDYSVSRHPCSASSPIELRWIQAVTDIPCLMFTEELISAYPDAKFLITTRDEDSWVKSITGLFNTILGWNWYVGSFDKVRASSERSWARRLCCIALGPSLRLQSPI